MTTVKVKRWGGIEFNLETERFYAMPERVMDIDLDQAQLTDVEKQRLLAGEEVCWYDEFWKLEVKS